MNNDRLPYKKAFGKISDEKRQRILDTATRVFAENGFTAANINIIARDAGVSIGAMYNYFDTKEDLYLTTIDYLHDILDQGLIATVQDEMSFMEAIESMFRGAVYGATEYRNQTVLYLNITAEPIEGLSRRLSGKLEGVTLKYYRELAMHAVASGEIPKSTDVEMLCFLIDNQIVALQQAYATDYHQARIGLFLDGDTDPEQVIPRIMKMIQALIK